MEKRVILSTDSNTDYSFFLPITAWLWQQIGYNTSAMIMQDNEHLTRDQWLLIRNSCPKHTIFHECHPIKGYSNSTVLQVSRIYIAAMDYHMKTYFLTGDVDMLPLSNSYFNQQDPFAGIHLFGSDLYNFEKTPLCYIGATWEIWNLIMGKRMRKDLEDSLGANSEKMEAWCFDEEYFWFRLQKTHKQFKIQNINRGTDLRGMPKGRVDRSAWGKPEGDMIDCHMLRPGYKEENFVRMMQLLSLHYTHEQLNWIHEYRQEFVTLGRV